MIKVHEVDIQLLAAFMFFGLLNEFAKLDEDFRLIMINFKIHSL
jgi:hypothetical protein